MRYLPDFWIIGFFLIITLSCSTKSTPVYQLVTSVEPTEAGTVTPDSGEYEKGESIELSATSNEHWLFEQWEGDYSGTENPVSLIMDADYAITARFVKVDYPLTIEIEGEGTVSQQIVQAKTTEYPHGTQVRLTAVPENGWAFIRWQGYLEEEENPVLVTVDEESLVTAVFEKIEYPLTLLIVGQGEVKETVVQAKTTKYPEGTTVELEAMADENWIFLGWSGDLVGDENPKHITIDEAKTVTVIFERTFQLTIMAKPEEGGTVNLDSGEYIRDTSWEVEAVPNNGWSFSHWEGNFSGSVNPFSLTMNGNKTITANFERNEYELIINIEGDGMVAQTLLSGTETDNGYLFESEVELTAIPNQEWGFLRWAGDLDGGQNPQTIVLNDSKEINVKFREKIRKFGGSGRDTGNSIVRTTDGGYMITGYSSSTDGDFSGLNKGSQDIFLIKFDESGNKEWIKTYGGTSLDRAHQIIPALGGGYLIAGETWSKDGDFSGLGHDNNTQLLLKVDNDGNIEWVTRNGGRTITQNSNGNIIAGGSGYLKELDQNGNLNWSVDIDGIVNSVVINQQNELVIAGSRGDWFNLQVLLMKLDDEGNILKEELLEKGRASSVTATSDGGSVVTGISYSKSGVLYGSGIFILKKDKDWNTEWVAITRPIDEDRGTSVIELSNKNFILTGHTGYWSNSDLIGDVYVAGFDRFGNKIWDHVLEDPPNPWPNYGRGYSLVSADNGNAAVVTGISNQDIILFKIKSDGTIVIMN